MGGRKKKARLQDTCLFRGTRDWTQWHEDTRTVKPGWDVWGIYTQFFMAWSSAALKLRNGVEILSQNMGT